MEVDTTNNGDLSAFYNKQAIENAPLDEQLKYLEHHLLSLGNVFIEKDISLDDTPELKKASRTGEDFYTFEDLFNDIKKTSGSETKFSLDAFKNLDGGNWKPVITKIKSGKNKNPLFLIQIYDTKKKKEVVQSYKLNAKGKLVLKDKNVLKEDVFGNSANNTKKSANINDENVYKMMLMEEEIYDGGNSGGGGSGSAYPKIQYLKIKMKKESWLERADVHIIKEFYPDLGAGHYEGTVDVLGSKIRKYRGKEVNDNIRVNYLIIQSGTDYPLFSYVIFERDNWPAPIKGSTEYGKSITNRYTFNQHYRSWENKYDSRVVSFTSGNPKFDYIRGFQNENNAIKYNFR